MRTFRRRKKLTTRGMFTILCSGVLLVALCIAVGINADRNSNQHTFLENTNSTGDKSVIEKHEQQQVHKLDTDLKYAQTAQLKVANLLQNPVLPNGCEIVSATIVLNYYGYDVSMQKMATKFLPKTYNLSGDPEQYYLGNPFSTTDGLYCFTGPIVTAINNYLISQNQDSLRAYDVSGSSIKELKTYVSDEKPVIVWVTTDMKEPYYQRSWQMNLHCLVMTGYDNDSIYLTDPLGKYYSVPIDDFSNIYEDMGMRAIVVK